MEIGPFTGDWGVNLIGTAFVLAGLGVFVKLIVPTRTETLIDDEGITCYENSRLKHHLPRKEIEWVDVSHGGMYGTPSVTIRLRTGEETGLHPFYFRDLSGFRGCLRRHGYPERDA